MNKSQSMKEYLAFLSKKMDVIGQIPALENYLNDGDGARLSVAALHQSLSDLLENFILEFVRGACSGDGENGKPQGEAFLAGRAASDEGRVSIAELQLMVD